MTVEELLLRISSRELSEWMAYYRLEPFGQVRGDLQAGIVASVMANAWGEKRAKSLRPTDFVLQMDEESLEEVKEPVEAKTLYERFRSWAVAVKG
jgi:hypothetical protein